MSKPTCNVAQYWNGLFDAGIPVPTVDAFRLAINPQLAEQRRAMILVTTDGATRAAVSERVASALRFAPGGPAVSLQGLRKALQSAGIEMHAPDVIYHVGEQGMPGVRNSSAIEVRQLVPDDAAIFEGFMAQTPVADQDDASVELGHWATFGAFIESELLAVSSLYPWGGEDIADMGVLTLPRARGKGLAAALVRTMIEYAGTRGYDAQYRCQHDNVASNRLAQSLGLNAYGQWEVACTP